MADKHKILIVEDDKYIINFISMSLKKEDYDFVIAKTCGEANALFYANRPDMIILDLGLPDGDGIEIIKNVREISKIPIIVVSARQEEEEKIQALDLGADDYVTKPFYMGELLARIRTSLRHSNRMASNSPLYIRPYKCQGLILDFEKRMLTLDGEEIHLTPVEYKIVAYLARNSGKVMTYASVMANVWGPFTDNNNRILRVNMANIRRKIERNPSQPQFLFTEVGVGYRMCEDENEV